MLYPSRFLSAVLVSLSLMALGCQATPGAVDVQGDGPRRSVDLNPGWKFIRQDVDGAEQVTLDDSSWKSISLPHTWNNLDGEDGGGNYYRGPGWYRRHLFLKSGDFAGKSLFLRFDGASEVADVYVNGTQAGTHKGMFAAFCFDITDLVKLDADNVLAIRVTNAKDKDIPPLSADFTFFGGIYRSVHLLALNHLSIDPADDASPGVYITQKNVSADHADLQIVTKLRNAHSDAIQTKVKCEVLDDQGQVAASDESMWLIAANDSAEATQKLSLDNPHLWNGRKDPYLYQVRVTISDGGATVDQVDQPLGLRFYHVDPDKGFFLNGQSYSLHGVNRHQDRPDKGWAISPEDHAEDFSLIMEMGCTAIRLAHYQHAQEFYNLCDRGGLCVWAEACMVNQVTSSQAFDDTAKQQVRELIKQNYNHPSILFWSLFNELHDEKKIPKNVMLAQRQHQIDLVAQLNVLAHQLDPTRLTTGASNRAPEQDLNKVTDVIGLNHYAGWYNGKPEELAAWLDHAHAALAGRGMAISEYGAGASIRQHTANVTQPKTTSHWHPEEWQCVVHEAAWSAMSQRHYLWGTFLWNMFDFASDGRSEGDHDGINDKGMITYDRKTKKDVFYFYKANWSDDPFVYITDRRFTPRNDGNGPVKIYSNCAGVDLQVNGQSQGIKTSDNHIFIWPDVMLNNGQNKLEAIGTNEGKTYNDSCEIVIDPKAVLDQPPAPEPAKEPAQ